MRWECSASGSLLEWRPHCLAGVLTELGIPGFELEPVLHPDAASWDRLVSLEVTASGLAWKWGGFWERVEVRPFTDSPGAAVSRRLGDPPSVEWRALSEPDAAEVTFLPAEGSDALTYLVERPTPTTSLRSSGGHEEIYVREPVRRVTLLARVYRRIDDGAFASSPLEFEFQAASGGQVCRVQPGPGVGAVAVIQRWPRRERLVSGYACVQGTVRAPLDEQEVEKLRQAVEKTPRARSASQPWEERWPHRSAARLRDVLRHLEKVEPPLAARPVSPQRLTGMFRQALLVRCGCPASILSAESLDLLSRGELCAALGQVFPGIPQLSAVPRQDEQVWLLRHAADARAQQAFEISAHRGAAALDRTLEVLADVQALRKLQPKLVEGFPESAEAKSLLDAFVAFIDSGEGLGQLRARRKRLATRVAALEKEALSSTDPTGPPLVEPRKVWAAERHAMHAWRQDLARVLAFCDSGGWPRPSPSLPAEEELMGRLRRLEAPIAPLAPSADPRAADVTTLARALVDRRAAEGDQALRELTAQQLMAVVLPHAGSWTALHHEIRQAAKDRQRFPWLAARFPAAAPQASLNQRAAAAQALLRLVAEAEVESKRWDGSTLFGQGPELLQVLTTPGHSAATHVQQELDRLRGLLHPSLTASVAAGSSSSAFVEPSALERAAEVVRRWWAHLAELARQWREVTRRVKEQRQQAADLWEQLRPAVQEMLACWAGRPQRERPPYYEPLRAAAAPCFSAERDPAPVDLHRLTQLLDEVPTWNEDWRRSQGSGVAASRLTPHGVEEADE